VNRPELIRRQNALDEVGRKRGWSPGPFRSWKVKGYTAAIAAKGWPRPYVAIRRGDAKEFMDLGDLEDFLLRQSKRQPSR
jgi:hypothetical protein